MLLGSLDDWHDTAWSWFSEGHDAKHHVFAQEDEDVHGSGRIFQGYVLSHLHFLRFFNFADIMMPARREART